MHICYPPKLIRPRLQPQALAQTPVIVPRLEIREDIHNKLVKLAQSEWDNHLKIILTMKAL
ncbi:MAG: hypothetical protein ABFS56_27565 [Pseudomonadota bacterium]